MSRQDYQPAASKGDVVKQGSIITPFQRQLLQKSLRENLPERYRQRIEIMLLADEGKSQAQICQALGCSQGTARYWICLARAGQAHNWNNNPIGRPKTVDEQYLERLKELVSYSPKDCGYPFQRWTSQWLSKHLAKEFGISVSDRHINRLLKQMGLSTRPKSATDEKATNPTYTGPNIVIRDIHSASMPESPRLWLFNSIR